MSKVLVTQSKLDTLAEVIGGKSNTQVPLTLDEMITAADSITSGGGGAPNLQTKSATYTPTTSQQTDSITADAGYDGLDEVNVTVNAVPVVVPSVDGYGTYKTVSGVRKWDYTMYADSDGASGWYDGEGTYTNVHTFNAVASGTTITPTTSSQTIGGANYMMEGAVTVSAMPTGTAGTPTASKGAVSNHSISVTPSVTNTTGYITGSTKTGTAVSVSASELVSGTLSITQNGTADVTNYASVDVSVSGGGMSISTASTTLNAANASITFTGLQDEPTSFVITTDADLATGASPYKTATVVYDGTNIFGQYITNTSNANVTYGTTFSQSYNNGTLTVTGTGSNFQANKYNLVYTYGGNSANIGTSDVQVGSGATSITFTDLPDEPSYFSLAFKDNFGTSSGYQRVISVVFDGSTTYGLAMDSSAKAQTSWSYTYNNGSLTISSTGTNDGGYFHQPGYYQLTYGIGGTVELDIQPLSVTENGTYQQSGIAYSPVVVNVSGGGSASIDTKTVTASNRPSSLSFTSMKGEPIAWCLKATFTMTSSSSTYYYVDSMRYNGSAVTGRLFQMGSTRQTMDVTSGYSYTYNNGTLTVSSTGNRTTSPGCFYNGSYELVYVY